MKKTKKVKTTGRFGVRYGVGIRKTLLKVEEKQKTKQKCPKCGFVRVKRKAKGIFLCKKCGYTFSGGAYLPVTMSGTVVSKMVTQKSFLPHLTELVELKERKPLEEKPEEGEEEKKEEKNPAKPKEKKKEKKKDKKDKKNKKREGK